MYHLRQIVSRTLIIKQQTTFKSTQLSQLVQFYSTNSKSKKDYANNTNTASDQQQEQQQHRQQQSSSSSTDHNNKKTDGSSENHQLMLRGSFENVDSKNRQSYLAMVEMFENRDIHRRNHVEFIYAALKNMEDFGVHRDIEVYKALMNVMPKEKYIPRNMFQAEFMHYPKQQQCIIDLLEQMEDNGVIPDYEMQDILVNTFGRRGHPVLKYWRMMYWMPKFKNSSPWPLPNPVPDESLALAKLAVERMCTVDLGSTITVYNTNEIESSIDDTWIVSGMSPEQSELLRYHNSEQPLHIEGPYLIWLRNQTVIYFTLRGDTPPAQKSTDETITDADDVSNLEFNLFGLKPKTKIAIKKSVHEQDDGTIYAICATGSSTKDSLLSWIRHLERDNNPCLAKIPIVFKFRSPVANQLVPVTK